MNVLAIQHATRKSWPRIDEFPELGPFERHVAMLLVEDVSSKMIARKLGVAVATVWSATYRLLGKLELHGPAGLARLAVRRGYVQP